MSGNVKKTDRRQFRPRNKDGTIKKLKLDEHVIATAAALGSTTKDIARLCNCSVDTLENHYNHIIIKNREEIKQRLRMKQIEVAMEGSVPMLIFLGKVFLGQREAEMDDKTAVVTAINIGIHPSRIDDGLDGIECVN